MDIDPDNNGLYTRLDKARMPRAAIKIAEKCGLRNIAANLGRDAMHFAAVDYGTV